MLSHDGATDPDGMIYVLNGGDLVRLVLATR
jgi:hypothetical protein